MNSKNLKVKSSKLKGISIIEVVIASGIIAVSVVGIVTALQAFLVVSLDNSDKAQAVLMLEETSEVVQYIRDKSWIENIAILDDQTDYYLVWNGLDYSLSETPQLEKGKFTRKLVFDDVERDSSDDIVENGSIDSGTKKVTVDIIWNGSKGNQTVSSQFLIHDVYQS